jgi:carboxypeptidase Q
MPAGKVGASTTRQWLLATGLALWLAQLALGQTAAIQGKTGAEELDRRLLALAQKDSQALANLTYLSDMIGPRLTGSAALRRANAWTAGLMKAYGLVNVHLEPWSLPEGWQRGPASARLLEPDNGRALSLASLGWSPGTPGKVQGDVVILKARTVKDLAAYKGKLKNAILLGGAPAKLVPLAEIEKPFSPRPGLPFGKGKDKGKKVPREEFRAFQRALSEFLRAEGAAVLLQDAGKHHGLLFTTGTWSGKDRPSATNRLPSAYVAHEHYEMLYRLARRPAPARTRLEIEITNRFVPGPIAVYNTVGEIRGRGKPDEVVVVGAHLDSWDLGTGTLDNGTGTTVVLETARILARCGTAPRRTIRFILFTGEEQGLHGSHAYVQQHQDDMAKISACLVHDTGTGKVLGLGWMGQPGLKPILETELAGLKAVGVTDVDARGFGGSDHMSFDRAGVPACIFRQEIAGYRFGHHSQADTLSLAREPGLIQGAQVMAISAMRLANLDGLLPRQKRKK